MGFYSTNSLPSALFPSPGLGELFKAKVTLIPDNSKESCNFSTNSDLSLVLNKILLSSPILVI
nr:MAG TPA: hypothetical protein [Bacteriophage sp.]